MIVPTRAGRFFYVIGMTAGYSGLVLGRTLAGDDQAARDGTEVWSRRVARGIGMDVRVFGGEGIDTSRPQVFMCNHQSHTDIIALFVGLPVVPGFLAKRELEDVPLFGRAMAAAGHVFVDRKDRRNAFAAIERAAEQVAEGRNLVVFPEGTRSAAGTVKRFKKGGFHLAKQARVPIVPVGIRGSAGMLPKHSKSIMPGRVEIHFGGALPPEEVTDLSLEDLVAEVRGRIGRLADMRLVDEK